MTRLNKLLRSHGQWGGIKCDPWQPSLSPLRWKPKAKCALFKELLQIDLTKPNGLFTEEQTPNG